MFLLRVFTSGNSDRRVPAKASAGSAGFFAPVQNTIVTPPTRQLQHRIGRPQFYRVSVP